MLSRLKRLNVKPDWRNNGRWRPSSADNSRRQRQREREPMRSVVRLSSRRERLRRRSGGPQKNVRRRSGAAQSSNNAHSRSARRHAHRPQRWAVRSAPRSGAGISATGRPQRCAKRVETKPEGPPRNLDDIARRFARELDVLFDPQRDMRYEKLRVMVEFRDSLSESTREDLVVILGRLSNRAATFAQQLQSAATEPAPEKPMLAEGVSDAVA